jgi:hypothetical protein
LVAVIGSDDVNELNAMMVVMDEFPDCDEKRTGTMGIEALLETHEA